MQGCAGPPHEGRATKQGLTCNVPGAALERVFPGVSFFKPTSLVQDRNDPTRFYVTEKGGAIKTVTTRAGDTPSVIADLSDRVNSVGPEPGVNGIAFHPSFPATNEVYVTYDAHHPGAQPPAVDYEWTLSRFRTIPGGAAGFVIDPTSEEKLIQIDKFDSEHNGGQLEWKNENGAQLLYVTVGDGSPANEQITGHPEIKPAQSTSTLLGKMLRIDPAKRQDGKGYGYPDDNPFAVKGTRPGQGLPEIYAWGLRNPWRFSFDAKRPDDLWLGDVGQDAWEEIDLIKKGRNYGWLPKEGAHCSDAAAEQRRAAGDATACAVPDEELPVAEYPHNGQSAAVIGGYVYHGKLAPDLEGTYIFGDYVQGTLFGIFPVNGMSAMRPIAHTGKAISSFAQDADGEVYVFDHSTGQVFRVVAGPCADTNGDTAAPYAFLMRTGVGDQAGANAYYAGFQEPGVVPGTYTLGQWAGDTIGIDPAERDPKKLSQALATVNRGVYRNKSDLGFIREMTCSKPETFAAAGAAFQRGSSGPRAGCMVRNWRSVADYADFMEGRTDGTATLGTVAMSVNNGFTHFYVFNAKGLLATQATLDSEGPKFAPQLCTTCHSGQYRGQGGSVNVGSIFREFEPDALDPGAKLVLDDPSGSTRVVASDATTAQAEWFLLNQSARAANVALLGDGKIPVAASGQTFDDTSATPGGFGAFRAANVAYIAEM